MTRTVLTVMFLAGLAIPAFAEGQSATGGPSGAPNQSQSVVPEGATGGRSGGPNQSQAVMKKKAKKKMHH